MTPSFKQDHAEIGRRALLAANKGQHEPLETRIQDLLTNLAHLADAEKLNFVEIVTHALRHWQVERMDPASVLEGPVVAIHIGQRRPTAEAHTKKTARQAQEGSGATLAHYFTARAPRRNWLSCRDRV